MSSIFEPILVLTTGGTIDKQYFDALSQYQITDTTVTKLLTIARVTHPFLAQEVLLKDSIDLTDDDRLRIVDHVRAASHSRVIEAERVGATPGGQALSMAYSIGAHVHAPAGRVHPQAERFQ
jgi:hypothetical protein